MVAKNASAYVPSGGYRGVAMVSAEPPLKERVHP